MIFVTVGTELPFDRMVTAIDRWAQERKRDDVFAQIGEGAQKPQHIQFAHLMEPNEFVEKFRQAKVIVAHAGMGTILSALKYEKPIIVMPRKASLGEQRNEHQLATSKHLLKLDKISVSFDEDELIQQLDSLDQLAPKEAIGEFASEGLLNGLKDFFQQD